MMRLVIISLAVAAAAASHIEGPFTQHFQDFMRRNNKDEHYQYPLDVIEEYGATGSFGGMSAVEAVQRSLHSGVDGREPVIFIHGNSDSALDTGTPHASGWNRQIAYFRSKGYSLAHLYGITYGDRNISNSVHNSIKCHDLLGIRRFVEAVLSYTNAQKVDIVGHSMGVSIARKIVKGGKVMADDGVCHLGASIANKVDTLLGISGANYGMCLCENLHKTFSACGVMGGFWPGHGCGTNSVVACNQPSEHTCHSNQYAAIIQDVNDAAADDDDDVREADNVVSIWSHDDEVLGAGNWVWGRRTSLIPGSDIHKEYTGLTHMKTKEETVHDQFKILTRHAI